MCIHCYLYDRHTLANQPNSNVQLVSVTLECQVNDMSIDLSLAHSLLYEAWNKPRIINASIRLENKKTVQQSKIVCDKRLRSDELTSELYENMYDKTTCRRSCEHNQN